MARNILGKGWKFPIYYPNVTHFHEADFNAYQKLQRSEKSKYEELIDKCGLVSKGTEENIFSKNTLYNDKNLITFVHPFYFYNHIKATGMLEFNPYYDKDITTKYEYFEPVEGKHVGKLTIKCQSNPYFAPYTGIGK